ncbi:tumor protein D52 isoform X3 [Amia ocellicauda]|uniref:tumor protein D52 isoform X3 n=1 Tax=Amia ocellicauda TaxID=2972642 RepID=UPI003463C8AE
MDLQEEYKSPFDFERGVNANYLYLSPSLSVTPPGSPGLTAKGISRPETIPEVGEDAASTVSLSATSLTEEEQEELRNELAKVEDEIQTLSQVLAAKERHVAEMKRKLGITPLNELKQNITKGWQDVTTSTAYVPSIYKRTSETLSQAGQKATAAFSTVGSAISKKLEDVRNSPTFKSFEEKVETLKTKVSNQPSTGDFDEVLNSTASASAMDPKPEEAPADRQGAR